MLAPVFLLFALTGLDPAEIARQAVKNYRLDQQTALKYSYTESDDDRSKGLIISEVSMVQGVPYERVVSRNGVKLTGEASAQEQRKYEKAASGRANESKSSRDKRLSAFEEQTKFLDEAPDAFNFQMLPQVSLDGRDTLVIACTPKAGFHPESARSKMFTKLEAKAWVDKQDLRVVKIEAEITDAVPIGLIMARVGKGTQMAMEQMRLSDGTWVLKKLSIEGKAKILLVDNKVLDETVVYSNYRKAASN